ncbi:MAG: YidC/Oxa1 family membrane protein insertase [Cellvibrionaceae bacterium]|jgi:YidC/Oxa1 family membrane protein insertase
MDWQRIGLIGGILLVSLVLLFQWNQFQDDKAAEVVQERPSLQPAEIPGSGGVGDLASSLSKVPVQPAPDDVPVAPTADNSQPTITPQGSSLNNQQLITVTTDTLDLVIDRQGGDIVSAVLPKHKVKLGGEQGIILLERTATATYIAQSGLVGLNGTDSGQSRPLFQSSQNRYQLQDGDEQLVVDLTLNQGDINYVKRFTFSRDQYLIDIRYLIDNRSDTAWQGNLYGQIKRDSHRPPAAADSGFGVTPFLGAATTTADDKYLKLSFSDLSDEDLKFSLQGGWVAMVQHYFTSAWVPNTEETNQFYLQKLGDRDMYLLGFIGPQVLIPANSQGEIKSRYYIGPKDIDHLEAIAEYLDLTIDFGWLWWIAKPLFIVLDFLHSYLGNWGWSIVLLTIIIKLIFFYPSAISYRSMAKMRQLSPKMQQIKERYGDDRQKMSQEMMKLYKTEKVNPMGGCLPILIQMPVFIALYWALMESVELRHAPFMLWINDLSVMDPYFVLPLIMGGTMFIQQTLNPTPPDPMQAKIMKWMPLPFTFLFLWFPAGLVLYWVTNNTLSITQQYVITKGIEAGK